MNIKPLANRVLVKPIVAESKTASGIFIPDSAKEKPQYGVVVEVGRLVEEPKLVQGAKILYNKYAGIEVKNGVDDLLIMKEDDILAIV